MQLTFEEQYILQRKLIRLTLQKYNEIYSTKEICRATERIINKADLDMSLNLLSEIERHVIIYHYFYNFTMRTVAEFLGISKSYVDKLEKSAINKITNYCFDENFYCYLKETSGQNRL
ncbi:sigma factor-like helix-turn-helix DNA-binding protein [Brevibacillus agri]|uniref:sigma factor-like helix-turn-helix DNA-binding protein n=1 Tax=Brevibacillus agri TaxID=51101 RepID=UPI0025B6F988|nr:sigma factor-like helix-turn-helix DNA-binding protein [Brevibacillus agri]MDN4094360.1 sigma factor-like helix-turn-helix DNA-binding protein [Brevibacillus agri]